ncbi:MAG TPA: hypothetical protein VN843_11355, partial [Anaerolineales bacterium]|nr:hypothetical protein [Anaerolineales bacterium]
ILTPLPSPAPDVSKRPSPADMLDDEMRKKYASANIGGAIVLFQAFPHVSRDNLESLAISKENLEGLAVIFRQVQDVNALVNVALAGKVRIQSVTLTTKDRDPNNPKFAVQIVVENPNPKAVEVLIPQGQVFEQKQLVEKQNLAALRGAKIRIPPLADRTIEVPAICINRGLNFPRGNLGNITIFELTNNTFVDQNDFSDWYDKKKTEVYNSQLLIRRTG